MQNATRMETLLSTKSCLLDGGSSSALSPEGRPALDEWVELVPGPSLRLMTKVFLRTLISFAILGVVTGALVIVSEPSVLVSVLLVIWSVTGLAAIVAAVVAFMQRDAEARRGYTTAPSAFINLATVDYRNGRILRKAGDPLLSVEDYERRMNSVGGNSS